MRRLSLKGCVRKYIGRAVFEGSLRRAVLEDCLGRAVLEGCL